MILERLNNFFKLFNGLLTLNLQVVQDLKGRIQRLPNFQRNVVSVRRQLMGVATSPEHKRYIYRPLCHIYVYDEIVT